MADPVAVLTGEEEERVFDEPAAADAPVRHISQEEVPHDEGIEEQMAKRQGPHPTSNRTQVERDVEHRADSGAIDPNAETENIDVEPEALVRPEDLEEAGQDPDPLNLSINETGSFLNQVADDLDAVQWLKDKLDDIVGRAKALTKVSGHETFFNELYRDLGYVPSYRGVAKSAAVDRLKIDEPGLFSKPKIDWGEMLNKMLERRGEDIHGNLTQLDREVDPGVKIAEKITYPDAGEDAPDAVQEIIAQINARGGDPDTPLLYQILGEGTPDYKMSKEDADYRHQPVNGQKCGNCRFAYKKVVTGEFICSQVEGNVQPEHWCRLWKGKGKTAADREEARATVTLTGDPGCVGGVLAMLAMMRQMGEVGASRTVKADVDGDGSFRLGVDVDKSTLPDLDELMSTHIADDALDSGDDVRVNVEPGVVKQAADERPFRRRVEVIITDGLNVWGSKEPYARGGLHFAGGGVDARDEKFGDAAVREVVEETGFRIGEIRRLTAIPPVSCRWHTDAMEDADEKWQEKAKRWCGDRTHLYVATVAHEGDATTREGDEMEGEWMSFGEAIGRLRSALPFDNSGWKPLVRARLRAMELIAPPALRSPARSET